MFGPNSAILIGKLKGSARSALWDSADRTRRAVKSPFCARKNDFWDFRQGQNRTFQFQTNTPSVANNCSFVRKKTIFQGARHYHQLHRQLPWPHPVRCVKEKRSQGGRRPRNRTFSSAHPSPAVAWKCMFFPRKNDLLICKKSTIFNDKYDF